MKNVILLLLIIFLLNTVIACSGSSGGTPTLVADSPVAVVPDNPTSPTDVAITLLSGRSMTCFAINRSSTGEVFCKGIDVGISLNSSTYIRYVSSTSAIGDIKVLDDTLCYQTTVSTRPSSRSAGVATYCHGEASLHSDYQYFPLVYSGPSYTDGANGSAGLTQLAAPFMGGDMTLDYLVSQSMTSNSLLLDGSSLISQETLSCLVAGQTLTCPNFTVDLN